MKPNATAKSCRKTTPLESLQRRDLERLQADSIEAKAWQALLDSEHELTKLNELRETARKTLADARHVQPSSADNEPLTPTRQRSLALTPKLNADIASIDER